MQELFTAIDESVWKELASIDYRLPEEQVNIEIKSLLDETVLWGGKRLRPLLTMVVADFIGADLAKTQKLARAVELVHGASLAHDDVVDSATLRRNRPSINQVGSNKKAVLAGDYLLADVIVGLAKIGNPEIVREMSEVIMDLAEGEWIQMKAAENRDYSAEIIEQIAFKKTSSVMSWCCVAPTFLINQGPLIRERLRLVGKNLGLGFQLIDDTFDFNENSEKDFSLDMKNGQVNSVLFELLQLDQDLYRSYCSGASIEIVNWLEHPKLPAAIQKVKKRAYGLLDECKSILKSVSSELGGKSSDLAAIVQIIDFLKARKS